jgi:uncharacterized protein with ATP-grasp and redox domains
MPIYLTRFVSLLLLPVLLSGPVFPAYQPPLQRAVLNYFLSCEALAVPEEFSHTFLMHLAHAFEWLKALQPIQEWQWALSGPGLGGRKNVASGADAHWPTKDSSGLSFSFAQSDGSQELFGFTGRPQARLINFPNSLALQEQYPRIYDKLQEERYQKFLRALHQRLEAIPIYWLVRQNLNVKIPPEFVATEEENLDVEAPSLVYFSPKLRYPVCYVPKFAYVDQKVFDYGLAFIVHDYGHIIAENGGLPIDPTKKENLEKRLANLLIRFDEEAKEGISTVLEDRKADVYRWAAFPPTGSDAIAEDQFNALMQREFMPNTDRALTVLIRTMALCEEALDPIKAAQLRERFLDPLQKADRARWQKANDLLSFVQDYVKAHRYDPTWVQHIAPYPNAPNPSQMSGMSLVLWPGRLYSALPKGPLFNPLRRLLKNRIVPPYETVSFFLWPLLWAWFKIIFGMGMRETHFLKPLANLSGRLHWTFMDFHKGGVVYGDSPNFESLKPVHRDSFHQATHSFIDPFEKLIQDVLSDPTQLWGYPYQLFKIAFQSERIHRHHNKRAGPEDPNAMAQYRPVITMPPQEPKIFKARLRELLVHYTQVRQPSESIVAIPVLYRYGDSSQKLFDPDYFMNYLLKEDERLTEPALKALEEFIQEDDFKPLAAYVKEEILYAYYRSLDGDSSFWPKMKKRAQEMSLSELPFLEERLEEAMDPWNQGHEAIAWAVAGNQVESKAFRTTLRERRFEKWIASILHRIPDFSVDHRHELWNDLSEEPKTVLYVVDNIAEITYDLPFLRWITQQGHEVILVGKEAEVDTKATQEDLDEFLNNPIVQKFLGVGSDHLHVISSGSLARGTDLRFSTPEFIQAWQKAAVIIVKGLENRETIATSAGLTKGFYNLAVDPDGKGKVQRISPSSPASPIAEGVRPFRAVEISYLINPDPMSWRWNEVNRLYKDISNRFRKREFAHAFLALENGLLTIRNFELLYIISNAINAVALRYLSREPGYQGKVVIRFENLKENGLRLEVRDNGIGFSEQTLQKLFNYGNTVKTLHRHLLSGGDGNAIAHYYGEAIQKFQALFSIETKQKEKNAWLLVAWPNSRDPKPHIKIMPSARTEIGSIVSFEFPSSHSTSLHFSRESHASLVSA